MRDIDDVVTIYLPTTEPLAALTASAILHPWVLFQTSADARAALLEALFDTAPQIRKIQFARQWNPRSGDLDPPDVDLDLPDWFDEPKLEEIEGPSDMVIEDFMETQTKGEWIVRTKHLARLTFEGFATFSDFYANDEPDIEVLDPNWNEHVMWIATHRVVTVTSEVRCTIVNNEVKNVVPIQVEVK